MTKSTSNTNNERKIKFRYKKDDEIFFTAFPKRHPNCFFICQGIIVETLSKINRPIYRVQIIKVGKRPLVKCDQANPYHLLNKIIIKKEIELTKYLTQLMTPDKWISK